MKVAVIGMGARGINYSTLFVKEHNVPIVAVCDINKARLEYAKEHFHTPDDMLFTDEDEFFAKGKLADICIVSTQDTQHIGHALKAMNAGYDLILEKPIAASWEDCNTILQTAKKLDRKIFICHVLRYTPLTTLLKRELDTGKYGKIVTINATECVGYWHQAHSFVRGAWRKSEDSTPMIIAKSCHDLDHILYLMGEDCTAVSSMGCLSYFKKENAPEGATKRCLDCPHKETCTFSAVKYYLRERAEKGYFGWPVSTITTDLTVEGITKALEETNYGTCVFHSDNNVVDHQVVNMSFANGATASFTMTGFSNYMRRDITIHCEKGIIRANTMDNKIESYIFGEEDTTELRKPHVIDLDNSHDNDYGHGGGDFFLIKSVVEYYNGTQKEMLSSIDKSMQSHLVGFKAEESRLKGGELIRL